MSHFAELDKNDIVIRVLVGDNAMSDAEAKSWFERTHGGVWEQTSYNKKIRKNFAGIGFKFDRARDAFIPPQPYASWTLSEETCQWQAPVPYPADGKMYVWSEPLKEWVQA